MKFFHHLLNPHCEQCIQDNLELRERNREDKICHSCETLRHQLEVSNLERQKLIDSILNKQPQVEQRIDTSNLKPIMPRVVPWHVKQQMLEEESRKAASVLKERQEEISKSKTVNPLVIPKVSIEELEEELEIVDYTLAQKG